MFIFVRTIIYRSLSLAKLFHIFSCFEFFKFSIFFSPFLIPLNCRATWLRQVYKITLSKVQPLRRELRHLELLKIYNFQKALGGISIRFWYNTCYSFLSVEENTFKKITSPKLWISSKFMYGRTLLLSGHLLRYSFPAPVKTLLLQNWNLLPLSIPSYV